MKLHEIKTMCTNFFPKIENGLTKILFLNSPAKFGYIPIFSLFDEDLHNLGV